MNIYTYSFTTRSLAIFGISTTIFVMLFYAAGFLSGVLWERERTTQRAAAPQPVVTAQPPAPVQPAAAPVAQPVAQSTPVAENRPAPPPEPVALPLERPDVRLTVQAASFGEEANASRAIADLRELGLSPEKHVVIDRRHRTWHVVRLGPYHDWQVASDVASLLRTRHGFSPAIRSE